MKVIKLIGCSLIIALLMLAYLAMPTLGAPYLVVTQTVPDTYVNDSTGQLYQVVFQSTQAETAQNVTVDIQFPSGFTFRTGTLVVKKNGGAPLTTNVTGTNPVHISFSSAVNLATGDNLTVTYRLATDTSLIAGEHYVLHVTGNYTDGVNPFNDQDETIINVKKGIIEVTLTPVSPDPFEAYRGDQIKLEAKITNSGDGTLFSIPFHIDWGNGFGTPTLIPGESNITPTLNGNSYEITIDTIPAGQSKYFRFYLTIASYQNFSLTLTATNPAEVGVEYTDSAIFNLLIHQPKIEITAPDITFEYGTDADVDITIFNNNASGTQGPAWNFTLVTTINAVMTVSNLAAGWSYNNGTFTYTANGGKIDPDQTVHLTFSITPINKVGLVEGPNGHIRMTASYKNDIDQVMNAPVVNPAWSVNNVPTLSIIQDVDSIATDGDNYRVFLSEEFTFKLTVHLTHTNKWQNGQSIVLTDNIPSDFTVTNAVSGGIGIINRVGNNITWTLTYAQASSDPMLTVSATATSDPDRAGNYIDNTATVTGYTIWSCTLTYTVTIQLYLQSRDAGNDYSYETKSITNIPAGGNYDVCGKDGKNIIHYQLDYTFEAGSTGHWTGSWSQDGMDQSQTYVTDTAQYKIGIAGAWTDIPGGSIIYTSPLKISLSFLKALFGDNDDVAGTEVFIRYNLSLTNGSLTPGYASVYKFLSTTDLMLANATGGRVDGSEHHFYQGVFVDISRVSNAISCGFSNTVTKGQTVRATVTVTKHSSWDYKNLIVKVLNTNGHYSYIGNPSYTGFDGDTPTVSLEAEYPDRVSFTFTPDLYLNNGGTISFDMVKTDDDDFSLTSQMTYQDRLNNDLSGSVTTEPDIQQEAEFSVSVNPNPVKVTTHGLTWQMSVTNIGSGRAYSPVFKVILKNFLIYQSSTIDGVPAVPTITDGVGTKIISWTLGNMDFSETKIVSITIDTDGSSSAFSNACEIIANPTWEDRDLNFHDFNIYDIVAPTFTTLISSTFVKNLATDPIELCDRSYDGNITLYVRNNGNTHNYNMILTQKFGLTGHTYIPGSATIGGVPINDPEISGTNLIWTYDSGESNYLPQLEDMSPQSEFTIHFDVQTHEACNIYQKIQPEATSWQKPYEYGGASRTGTYLGAEYRVPILQPSIVLTVDGKNIDAGDVGYTDNVKAVVGDEIEWRLQITNSGTAAAKNVYLTNVLPANMTFISLSPAEISIITPGQKWKINDIPVGTTTYYVRATFDGPCDIVRIDNASVTWGPETGLIDTPSDNDDTANLISQPHVDSADINITNFTTKVGHVVVTLVTSGAPAFDLNLTLDLTNRFELDSAISYSSGLSGPSSEPSLGTDGNAPLTWHWDGPISAGTHTITFDIRDANHSCNGNASITPDIDYTYKNSSGDSFNGSFNSKNFTPAKTILSVTKTPAVQIIDTVGNMVTWTIQVTNTGTANATDLEIVDTLGDGTADNGFTYSATTSPAASTVTGNVLKWTNLDLNVGQTYTITLKATANAAGIHTNTVTATEYNRDFIDKVDEKSVNAAVSLVKLDKVLDQSTLVAYDTSADSYGEVVKYTVTIDYLDTCDYSNLVVNDTLPTGLQYVSESTSATKTVITPNHAGKNLVWNLTDFTGPDTVTITYYARIIDESQARGSTLTNAVKNSFNAHYSNGIDATFPNTLPQLQDQQTFTLQRPDVTMSARSSNPVSGSSVFANQTINHTLTVLNQNLTDVSPAYEIKVQETIPTGERTTDPSASVVVKKDGSTTLTLNTDYTCTYNSGNGQLTITMLNTSLGVLQKNETYVITYNTTVNSDIGSGVTLDHSAQLVNYYSQPTGTTGVKSYTGNTRTASYTTQSSSYALTITSPVNGKVKPGDTVTYHIAVTVSKGTSVYDISLSDTLPIGLSYNNGTSDGFKKSGSSFLTLTPTVSGNPTIGQTLTWAVEGDNVDITNNDSSDWTLTMDFTATVLDVAAIAQGNTLTDTCLYNYNKVNGSSGSRTSNSSLSANLTVNEPTLTITKTITSSGPYQAGSTVTYRIRIQNSSTETAYDTVVTDTLNNKFTISGTPTYSPGGVSFSQVGQLLTFGADGALDIAPSSTQDIFVSVILNDTVKPQETLGNSATVQSTSQNGANANERTYTVNSSTVNISVADNTNLAKAITGSPTYVIGETFHYQLTMTISKGTTSNVVVYDTLPVGVEFVSATLTPDGSGAVSYTLSHSPSAGDQGAINWNFGSIVVPSGQNGTITIDYIVRIMDVGGNFAGQVRTNSAYLNYKDANDTSHDTSTQSQSFTIKEPVLTVTKTITSSGPYQAGSIVNYRIRIQNTSTVTAYDVNVTDTLNNDLTLSGVPTTNPGGVSFTQVGQLLTFGADGNLDIAPSSTVDIFVNATLNDTVKPQETIGNSAAIQWTSLNGIVANERTYNLTSSTVNIAVADNTGLTKAITGSPTYVIGETFHYLLTMTLNKGTTNNVVVYDTLPAGVEFVSTTLTPNGSGDVSYTLAHSPSAGDQGAINWNFGSVLVPSGQSGTITIDYIVRILDVGGNFAGQVRTNSAYLSYKDANNNSHNTSTQSQSFTIKEPVLTVTKTVTSSGPYQAGSTVSYRIRIQNTGTVTAYDVNVSDTLNNDLTLSGVPTTSPGGISFSQAGQLLTFGADGNLDIAPSSTVDIFVNATLNDTVKPQETIGNSAAIQWTSLNGIVANERTYNLTSSTVNIAVADNTGLTKAITGSPTYVIGETFHYLLTMTLDKGTTNNVVVYDTLPAGLEFVSATLTPNGSGAVSYTLSHSPSAGDQGAINWNFGSVLVPSGQSGTITIDYIVRILDVGGNFAGQVRTNSAYLSYKDANDTSYNTSTQSQSFTIKEPNLGVSISGPGTIDLGQQATITVDISNSGTSIAWQSHFSVTLPPELRDQAPIIQSLKTGTRTLSDSSPDDYDESYNASNGQWDFTLKTNNARVLAGETLVLIFKTALNTDEVFTVHDITIDTQVNQYYSLDSSGGVSVETRTYSPAGVIDHHTLTIQTPVILTNCTVDKPIAHPGETVQFTVTLTNNGNTNATSVDYTGDLNADFSAGTLTNVTTTSGSKSVNPTGGVNGTGCITINNITIPHSGGTVTITWDITLKPVLPDGHVVDDMATLTVPHFPDPITVDISDVTIDSAPAYIIQKRDTDINGGTLLPDEVIKYTITIINNGDENANNCSLKDLIPSNTIYVPASTKLNGVAVSDDGFGQSPLVSGMIVKTPGDPDGWLIVGKTATIEFQVQVDPEVTGITIIANQAELTSSGEGFGPLPAHFSDDPDTTAPNDATLSVVGTTPALYAYKTVTDNNGGQLLPNEVITYHTTLTNYGSNNATATTYLDYIPTDTTFINDSILIDGVPSGIIPSGGQFTCNLGTVAFGDSVDIEYQVRVNNGTNGHIIRCQGQADCAELPPVASDADGNPTNGYQPTEIPVGSIPVLRAYMSVSDVNGGHLEVDELLEYLIRVTNIGSGSATNVTLIAPIPTWTTYVDNTTLVEGAPYADRSGSTALLTPGINLGTIAAGQTVTIQYRVQVDHNTPLGSVIDNQADFTADGGIIGISDSNLDDNVETGNDPSAPNDDDPTRVQLSGNPFAANLKGTVWWDQDYDDLIDSSEPRENRWKVELYQGNTLIETKTTDVSGNFEFIGITPGSGYLLKYKDPTNNQVWKIIDNVTLLAGTILDNQNYPLHPTGIIYDAVTRQPVPNAIVTITGSGGFDPTLHLGCGQATQTTGSRGEYYFDLLFNNGAPEGTYTIAVTPPITYSPVFPSTIISPQIGDYIPLNLASVNEVVPNAAAPQNGESTIYYLSLQLAATDHQVVNNHIALDPILEGSVVLTKSANKRTATKGDFVKYTLIVRNLISALITPLTVQDTIPFGFKYVKGTARVNGVKVDPTGTTVLSWTGLSLAAHATMTVTYDLMVGSGVSVGHFYQNSALAIHGITGTPLSNVGSVKVQILPEPHFDYSFIIGKVFHDKNANGVQDQDEPGLPGIKLYTVSGEIITTDDYGRYHVEGIPVKNFVRGQNFVIKVDPKTIPVGMYFTTENPRVVRLTQGLMAKINFGVRYPDNITPTLAIASPTPIPTATLTSLISPTPEPFTVNTLRGFNKGSILLILNGDEFVPGIIPKLTSPDGTKVIAGKVIHRETTKITVFFDINNVPPGEYNILITLPDGQNKTLNRKFTIDDFAAAKNLQTLNPIYFDFDKSNIRPNQVPVAEKDLVVIKANPQAKIILGGYTDERGNIEYNLGLSERRATSIVNYLINNGVAAERIAIYAYGKEFAQNGNNENVWQNDRRVDVILYEE